MEDLDAGHDDTTLCVADLSASECVAVGDFPVLTGAGPRDARWRVPADGAIAGAKRPSMGCLLYNGGRGGNNLFPVAHVVSALILNRVVYTDTSAAPAIAASLLPDAADKTLSWVLRVTVSSHHIAHTPLAALWLSLSVAHVFGARAARAFGTAYLLHLITDDLHHGRVPWLMPFSNHRRLPHPEGPNRVRIIVMGILLETISLALAIKMSRSVRPHQTEINPLRQ
jgi:LexA-binding, inner membrane-associated putative hydrolase